MKSYSRAMLENQNEGKDYDPVDEADLDGTHPRVVLVIHDFLQLFIALLHLHTRLLDMEINTIEDCPLLDDKIAHITEQIA